MDPQTYISVIGPSDAPAEILRAAEQVGACVAKAGAILVTGGGGGAMQAASRGARAAGGRTLGILPGSSRDEGNAYLDVAVPTGMGEMRNVLVVRTGDGIVAVGGGFGTLSEIALALKLGKPVVGIGTWSASIQGREAALPTAATAEEAVKLVLAAVD
ncbi:MAG TPA: TIGR00725 family protein [Actinomycetota bacterium]|nr:TIGR00725 family protein [Actinomycetota bacterium]